MPTTLYEGGEPVHSLRTEGQKIDILLNEGQVIYVRDDMGDDTIAPFRTHTRTVEDGGEKWFEVGIPILASEAFPGNAAAGWTYMNGFFGFRLQYSRDLQSWEEGKFTPAPGSPEAVTLGGEEHNIHWGRCVYPVDSDVKSGSIWSQLVNGDSRMSPMTSIVINGVVQALANYPYTMPGHAAQLQADLRAVGWMGATVSAADLVNWRIDIPSLAMTVRNEYGKVFWPTYQSGTDPYGNPMYSSHWDFKGELVNAQGVRTDNKKGFARIAITQLKPFTAP